MPRITATHGSNCREVRGSCGQTRRESCNVGGVPTRLIAVWALVGFGFKSNLCRVSCKAGSFCLATVMNGAVMPVLRAVGGFVFAEETTLGKGFAPSRGGERFGGLRKDRLRVRFRRFGSAV